MRFNSWFLVLFAANPDPWFWNSDLSIDHGQGKENKPKHHVCTRSCWQCRTWVTEHRKRSVLGEATYVISMYLILSQGWHQGNATNAVVLGVVQYVGRSHTSDDSRVAELMLTQFLKLKLQHLGAMVSGGDRKKNHTSPRTIRLMYVMLDSMP